MTVALSPTREAIHSGIAEIQGRDLIEAADVADLLLDLLITFNREESANA